MIFTKLMSIQEKNIKQAYLIATENLRQCYKDGKVIASLKNFSDFWARDTFWALPGVLEIGDNDIARACLEYFLSLQRSDGKIPRKISVDFNGLKYLTGKSLLRKKPRPIYTGNLPPFSSMDANSLLIIAAADFIIKTSNEQFAQIHYAKMKAAIDWYKSHTRNGFVREFALGNWMDTVFKNGHVLYSNVLYCEAFKQFSCIAEFAGWENDCGEYREKHLALKKKIDEEFWNGEFYDDQLGKHDHFDLAGNVLALYFKIAIGEKKRKIIEKIIQLKKGRKLLPTVNPRYPWWKINPVTYLLGMQNYQNDVSWMWIDLFAVAALFENDYISEAKDMFSDICNIIVQNGAVHETYFSDGTPYKTTHWESAVPFAWGSGVFLKIYSKIFANDDI